MPLIDYVYYLPYDINKELCKLLDYDDDWKILAGKMSYTPFEINDMEQMATRQKTSPTGILLSRWGQYNHKVTELFVLLYWMEHVPAMRCIINCIPEKFRELLHKLDRNMSRLDCKPLEKDNANQAPNNPKKLNLYNPAPPQKNMNLTANTNKSKPSSSKAMTFSDGTRDSGRHNSIQEYTDPISRVGVIRKVSYAELQAATGNWDKNNLLGKGGFGEVYKGEWMRMTVAVKILKNHPDRKVGGNENHIKDINKELVQEMCLNQYRHDNIVPLYCYSIGGPEMCIVYKYVSGGTLDDRLRHKTSHPPLTWAQRHRIALGVANGLQFLHTVSTQPLIHGDIKPANILLDHGTMPLIGDFGLARQGVDRQDATHVIVTNVRGTKPYLPIDYISSRQLSPAVDVFSFGVVIVEMATALLCQDKKRAPKNMYLSFYIHNLVNEEKQKGNLHLGMLEDGILRGTVESHPQLCHEFITLGVRCTNQDRHKRPTMLEVHDEIKNMLTLLTEGS